MRLATIGLGYADGLLRHFGGKGTAFVKGERRALAGRVSMDASSVSMLPASMSLLDDWVEIFGDNQPIDDMAAAATGRSAMKWLTRLGSRLPRVYK